MTDMKRGEWRHMGSDNTRRTSMNVNREENNIESTDYSHIIEQIIVPEGVMEEKQAELYEPLSRYLLEKMPSALYRFRSCNERNFNAFDKGELWFSRAETMNDDFDSLVYYDREAIASEINQAFEQLSSNMKSMLSNAPIELQQMLHNMPVSLDSNELLGVQQPFLERVNQELENVTSIIRKIMKFACFSDNVESPLMWGHYADSSRGFALAYDFRNSGYTVCDGCVNKNICQNKRMCALYPMVYTNERLNATQYIKWLLQKKLTAEIPNAEIRAFLDSSLRCPDQFMLTKILIYKAEAWKPEREWRLVCSCNAPQYNNEQYSYAIQAPTALYLGSQISPVNEKLLCYLAKGKGIPVYKMSVSPNSLQYRLTANLVTNM